MIKHGGKGEILSKDMKEMNAALTRSSEVKTTKMSPVECIKNGVAIDKAREMSIGELTREDAELLLNHGVSKHGLSKLYGSNDGTMYPKLTKWGLHKPSAAMTANQRLDAFEIECPNCHEKYKRGKMIDTHDRGMLCLRCYDEANKPVPEVKTEEDPQQKAIKTAEKTIDDDGDEHLVKCGICGKDIMRCDAAFDSDFVYVCNDCEAAADEIELKTPAIADSGQRTEFGTGAVRDMHEGKGDMVSIPAEALLRVSRHYEYGAKKYERFNFRKGIPLSSFMDSALRHIMMYECGCDDEDHLSAAAFNILGAMLMENTLPNMIDLPLRKGKRTFGYFAEGDKK